MKETKDKKTTQLNIRISDKQKDEITKMSENAGYKSISKFLIDVAMNDVKIKTKENRKIFVMSLSTAIDYFIKTNEIDGNKNGKNKFLKEDTLFVPGGRGINLSRMLNIFNVPNFNINISGGFSGYEFHRLLEEQGVRQYRIQSNVPTKINVYAEDSNGNDISLEEKTGPLSSFAKEEFSTFIKNEVSQGSEFVLSGSFVEEDIAFMKEQLETLVNEGVKIYVNSSTPHISEILGTSKPELIILNQRNFNGEIKSKKEIFKEMEKFIDLGCENVAYVADVNYSLFMNKDTKYLISSDLIDKLTYSGLEDAFLAGYISNDNKEIVERLKWSAASVKAKAEDKDKISFDHIVHFMSEIEIVKE